MSSGAGRLAMPASYRGILAADMPTSRRAFLHAAAVAAAGSGLALAGDAHGQATTSRPARPIVKAPRLKPGDTVGLVNPAGATWSAIDIDIVRESFEAM